MPKQYVVGIDIGGQTSKLGVVDARGDVLSQTVIRTDTFGRDADAYIAALAEAVKSCVAQADMTMDDIRGIGVGAPNGNYYTGEVAFAPNLAWAADQAVPLSKKLSEACGVPVSLTNDANAAAVGEMAYGAARGMKNFIMITLGTGVGSGIVVDGKVLYGHDGFAGELGHTCVVRNNGRTCGCGKTGCLEAYCSAMGIARTAREWLEASGQPTPLRDLQNITSKDIYDAAKQGDNFSLRLFEYTGTLLGQSFADPGGHRALRRPRPRQGVPLRADAPRDGGEPPQDLEGQGQDHLLPAQGVRRRHPRRLGPRLGTVSKNNVK